MSERLTQMVEWVETICRMPERNQIVAVATRRKVTFGWITDGDKWKLPTGWYPLQAVTHWAKPLMHPATLSDERAEG